MGRNFTRDVHHPLVASIYCNNLNHLTVTLNGERVDSKTIVNIYQTAHERPPYIQVWEFDQNGKIILGPGGGPIVHDLEGEIHVEGRPTTCGCYRGRKIKDWWRRIEQGAAGW